jgi:tRNA(Leu) C34 or U34 (ribose-2'-O)-methylase TrmL
LKRFVLAALQQYLPNKEIHKRRLALLKHYNGNTVLEDVINKLKIRERQRQLLNKSSAIFFKISKSKKNKYAFVFGNEVHGVSQDAVALCDGCIEIHH